MSFAPEPIDSSEPETTQARKAGEGAFWYALRNAGWTAEQIYNGLNTYRGMIAAELAQQIRETSRTNYGQVSAAYGHDYARGWASGRQRGADQIDPGVSKP